MLPFIPFKLFQLFTGVLWLFIMVIRLDNGLMLLKLPKPLVLVLVLLFIKELKGFVAVCVFMAVCVFTAVCGFMAVCVPMLTLDGLFCRRVFIMLRTLSICGGKNTLKHTASQLISKADQSCS